MARHAYRAEAEHFISPSIAFLHLLVQSHGELGETRRHRSKDGLKPLIKTLITTAPTEKDLGQSPEKFCSSSLYLSSGDDARCMGTSITTLGLGCAQAANGGRQLGKAVLDKTARYKLSACFEVICSSNLLPPLWGRITGSARDAVRVFHHGLQAILKTVSLRWRSKRSA